MLGWAAHAAGLAAAADGDPRAALALLETARRRAEEAGDPLELGRVLVAIGACERRLRRKRPARAALERAIELFAACGAQAWAERARLELARALARPPSGRALTVTERRVCERAADGWSNAEIAAELYLSRRTVDSNLLRAYAKLGIRSRAQLGRALAAAADGDASRSPLDGVTLAVQSAEAALLRPRRRSFDLAQEWAEAS
jgi:DNA-binding CsgD family transcriptional regulator